MKDHPFTPLIAALALVVLSACGKSDGPPSCRAVSEAAAALLEAKTPEAKNPATSEAVTALIGPIKEGIAKKCETGHWPPAVRECFVHADTLAAANACTQPPPAKTK